MSDVALIPDPAHHEHAFVKPIVYLGEDRFKAYQHAVAGARFDPKRKVYVVNQTSKLPPILKRLRDAGFGVRIPTIIASRLAEQEAVAWLDMQAARERLVLVERELEANGHRLREYQRQGVEWLTVRKRGMLADGMGLGKEQPISTPVLTPSGWVTIGSLRVGNQVIGSDGKPIKVTGVYVQGKKDVYRVTLDDGSSTRCGLEHLWAVQSAKNRYGNKPWKAVSLKQIIGEGLRRERSNRAHRWFIPLMSPARFSKKNLPIHPYLLGALIANGSLAHDHCLHTGNLEQQELLKPYLPKGVDLRPTKQPYTVLLGSDQSGRPNPLIRALKELGLNHTSPNKFIPTDYLFGSVEQRTSLLQGLCDNDGTIHKDGMCIEYNTTSPQLAADVLDLIRSLGGVAWQTTRTPKYTYKGEVKLGRADYRIRMALPPELLPFRLSNKLARVVPRTKYPPTHAITSVEHEGREECVCISVDAHDKLYVTENFILTHNSVQTLCALPANAAVLVIGPAIVKSVWARETARWRPGLSVKVIEGRGNFRWPKVGEVIVMNFDILPDTHKEDCERVTEIKCAGCHPHGIPDTHIPDCKRGRHFCKGCLDLGSCEPGTVCVVDEAHNIKNSKTRRAEAVRAITGRVLERDGRAWSLTGTPILNRPDELWNVLEAFDLAHEAFGTWKEFCRILGGKPKMIERKKGREIVREQKGWDWGQPSPEAVERLQRVCLRRVREDVLQDLPPKTRELLPIEVDRKSLKGFDRLLADLGGGAALDKILRAEKIPFEMMSKVRAALATAKIPAMLEIVQAHEKEEQLLVVFSAHRQPIDLLAERDGWATITGSTSNKERGEIVEAFQKRRLRGLGATIQAGGVGITLTEAHNMLFVDQEWTPALNEQAEDRCLRHGQKNPVLVKILVANHILDERIAEILNEKMVLIGATVDAARDRGDRS